jgi:hypothetical protein
MTYLGNGDPVWVVTGSAEDFIEYNGDGGRRIRVSSFSRRRFFPVPATSGEEGWKIIGYPATGDGLGSPYAASLA